jgi:hypothetical protein
MSTRKQEPAGNGEEALAAALARLRPRGEIPVGWEERFAARVLARAHGELTRRAEVPSFWQLLSRWPAPLVPAAAAALALALLVVSNGEPAISQGVGNESSVEVALGGDPLAAVVTDPVLTLIAAESNSEATP